jgi:hypothetical protein
LITGGVNRPDLYDVLAAVNVEPAQPRPSFRRGRYLKAIEPDSVADHPDIVAGRGPAHHELSRRDLRRLDLGDRLGRFGVLAGSGFFGFGFT